MGYRKIVTTKDEEFLRKISRPVEVFDEKLGKLLDDMRETMYRADGVGLAAPQIGLLKRIAVVDTDGTNYVELVNPEILETQGSVTDVEGCLSVPRVRGEVPRPEKCTVRAYDRHGKPFTLKAEGFYCRAICHECDHLDGILFIDKATRISE